MENIIYNELRCRGYSVDVGVVEITETVNGKRAKSNVKPWTDENGILHIGLYEFLLNQDSLDA